LGISAREPVVAAADVRAPRDETPKASEAVETSVAARPALKSEPSAKPAPSPQEVVSARANEAFAWMDEPSTQAEVIEELDAGIDVGDDAEDALAAPPKQETEDEQRHRRRRRRRRGRGREDSGREDSGREDSGEEGPPETGSRDDEDEATAAETAPNEQEAGLSDVDPQAEQHPSESAPGDRPRRGRRRRRGRDRREASPKGAAPVRNHRDVAPQADAPGSDAEIGTSPDDADDEILVDSDLGDSDLGDSDLGDTDDAHGDAEKHRKIPTWREAINLVIDVNMDSRSRTRRDDRGDRGGRGRGGRR
jgi:ribonuclease E